MDTRPRGTKAPVPTPPGGEAPEGTSKSKEGAGCTLLPATFRTRGGRTPGASRSDPRRLVLVVYIAAGKDSQGSTFLSSAEGGGRRLRDCGRESRGTVSRVAREHPQSASSSEMYERRQRFWSSWRTLGWAGCQVGS